MCIVFLPKNYNLGYLLVYVSVLNTGYYVLDTVSGVALKADTSHVRQTQSQL